MVPLPYENWRRKEEEGGGKRRKEERVGKKSEENNVKRGKENKSQSLKFSFLNLRLESTCFPKRASSRISNEDGSMYSERTD